MTVLNSGRGLCAELLPELITLDEWGYPIVRAAEIPAGLERQAERAIAACPVLAFRRYPNADAASKVTPLPVQPGAVPASRAMRKP